MFILILRTNLLPLDLYRVPLALRHDAVARLTRLLHPLSLCASFRCIHNPRITSRGLVLLLAPQAMALARAVFLQLGFVG